MKRWKLCAVRELMPDRTLPIKPVLAKWEKFAQTGECSDIPCQYCPFKQKHSASYSDDVILSCKFDSQAREFVKDVLNEEVAV